MKKKQKIIAGVCAVVCIGGLAAGIFSNHNKKEKEGKELAYVMSVSSMNEMAGIQRMSGVVESQKTQDIQKDSEREVKEVLVKAGDEVDVGTALFTYDTEKLEGDLQQAQLDLERADNDMANLKAQIAQLRKDKENASEDEQLSYTTQIQSGEMDLKKSEYERKAKEVEINRLQSQIQNSTVKSDMKGIVKSVNNGNNSDSNMYSDSSQAFMTILATGQYRIKGAVNEQNVSQVVEGQPAIIRSRVDENATWRGTYTAVDAKNPNNSNNKMMYGMSSEEASQNTSTSYPFYVELESSEGLLLGQHVYIEQDNGLEEREKGI
ncbi:MAG TPA: efflux RND transporter periplasmic adaptor subunit, partial [Candidatus Blautia stercoravium]|nr:efflux RND transporter periplasmic adaptor subunit [Candidatus Blautia stercoravium]